MRVNIPYTVIFTKIKLLFSGLILGSYRTPDKWVIVLTEGIYCDTMKTIKQTTVQCHKDTSGNFYIRFRIQMSHAKKIKQLNTVNSKRYQDL